MRLRRYLLAALSHGCDYPDALRYALGRADNELMKACLSGSHTRSA